MRSYLVMMLGLMTVLSVAVSCQSSATTSSTDKAMHSAGPFDKPGFITEVEDGRLWVFRPNTEAYEQFKAVGEPAKSITLVGAGPAGMSVRAVDKETAQAYLVAKPGFYTEMVDGRIWVFETGSEGLAEYKKHGEPAKSVTVLGAGPNGETVRSDDRNVIANYSVAKPGFYTEVVDGRIWVFKAGSEDLAEYKKHGEPAKCVTILGAGPNGETVRSSENETIMSYAAAKPGFYTEVKDGRLWIFRLDSEDLAEFKKTGEPAKSVTRIGEGPMGMTVRSSDTETLDAYKYAM